MITISTLNSWGLRRVKDLTHSPKLITTKEDRYSLIHNTLQPIWRKYKLISSILQDNKRTYSAGEELLHLMDFLKSMGFRHDALDTLQAFNSHIEYLLQCGMRSQLRGFFRSLIEMEIIQQEFLSEDHKKSVKETFYNFIPFWRESCEHLIYSGFITLEDQKYWAWLACERQLHQNRRISGAAQYHHILVDEFQDINPLDLSLLKAIAKLNKAKITIVGDDDQAIYEWRGASPTFIVKPDIYLGEHYQTCELSVNYRSPKNIVEMSQKLINHNRQRVQKNVTPHLQTEARVEIRRYSTISSAISHTVELVKSLLRDPTCSRVTLIGRKRSQIIPYQIVFAGQGIPFCAAEDLNVLLSNAFRELKDILTILARSRADSRYADDPVQDLVRRCDKVKRYPLSRKDREALQRHLYKKSPATLRDAVQSLRDYTGTLKGENSDARMSRSFADALLSFIESTSVAQAIQAVSKNFAGLQKDYGKSLEDIFFADPPFLYLSDYAKRYGDDFNTFFRDIEKAIASLAPITPGFDDEQEESEPDWKLPLHLMTALRSKGKEFDAVIILDANQGIWPSELATEDSELEQERRLFYVAVTRARRYLYFIVNDDILGSACLPSMFLNEMGLKIPDTIEET